MEGGGSPKPPYASPVARDRGAYGRQDDAEGVSDDPGRTIQKPLTVLLVLAVLLAGCARSPPAPPTQDGEPGGDATDPHPPNEDALASRVPAANATRLMEIVRAQIYPNGTDGEVRYRVPGTASHDRTVPDLVELLDHAGAETTVERFRAELPELGEVNLTNVYGVREGTDPRAGEIWLAAHWDSRAWADAHRDACTGPPVQGANDGAAAVAVVVHALELLEPTNRTVRVALFDAEDQGGCGGDGWAIGSEHAADRRERQGRLDEIGELVLVDMPGAGDLEIRREGNSHDRAPRLTDLVFGVADRLNATTFSNTTGPAILDDHVPFLERGVSAVDLIHLDQDDCRGPFPCTHHTEQDTVENLHPPSMQQVTRVVVGTVLVLDDGPDAR